MKYIAAFLIFTVTMCHGLRLPSTVTKELALEDDDECPSVFSCKDCNTVRLCRPDSNGNLKKLTESTCPTQRPWCDADSGTCTDKEPGRCGTKEDFVCLKKNHYFPDNNCHQFHFCDEKYVSTKFECNPPTKVFNPLKQQCDDPKETPCGTFDCSNSAVKKAKHGEFVEFYALCNNQGANTAPLVVNVCPKMYVLNITSQLCEPDCKRYGSLNIADYEDCHYYYHCNRIFYTSDEILTNVEKHKCPEGFAYDDTTSFMCVDEKTVEACNK